MANPEHVEILKQGVEVWNRWRKKNPQVKPDLCQTNLAKMDLRQANLRASLLSEVDFTGTNLADANLVGTDLRGTLFDEAILSGADLSQADLREANLYGTHLYLATLKRTDLRQAYLEEAILTLADLTKARFCKANLRGAALDDSILHYADFREAILAGANMRCADLFGAILIKGNLTEADFTYADLTAVDFNGAWLNGTNFSQATLDAADFSNAILDATILDDINLATTTGLDRCHHRGPSAIDYRTLVQSGRLPLAFLRGCGLPEVLIDYLPSILNEPIQFYSCFISYSHVDEEFCRRLHSRMQDDGLRVWFAPHNIQGGRKLHDQIDEAIRVYDKLLLVLSEHSMSSEWVKTEIANARQREIDENRRMLFPIRLVDMDKIKAWRCFDADTGKDSAREIREYFIPDFSNWKDHDSFEQAFERLLRDLQADETRSDG